MNSVGASFAGLLVAFAFLAGCGKDGAREITTLEIDDIPKEIRIPHAVWDEVQGKAAKVAEEVAGSTGPELADEGGGVLFMPVDVVLEEKNPGVLRESPLRIRLPRGGGAVDLAAYVGDKPGSFFVRFEWPDVDDMKTFQAFFVSKARRRKLGDETWGAGCNKWYRVTNGIQQAMKKGGLKVNTTRDRHVTVLGGHFVFAAKKHGQAFSAQVSFVDSRKPDFYCEEPR